MKEKTPSDDIELSRLRVRTLTDNELLNSVLHTNDPLSLSNLSDEPPADDQELTFEMTYEADTKIQCVFGHWHKKGIVLGDEKGKHYCVGCICGEEKFGIDWNIMQNARQALVDRRDYLIRLENLRAAINAQAEWLRALPNHPAVQAFDVLRQTLLKNAQPLCKAIRQSNGVLEIDVAVRDFAAEERRREQDEQDKQDFAAKSHRERDVHIKKWGVPVTRKGELFKYQKRNLGTVVGQSLFASGPPLRVRIDAIVQMLFTFAAEAQTSSISTSSLKEKSMRISGLLPRLTLLLADIRIAEEFFEHSALNRLTEWANQMKFPGLTFSVASGELRIDDSGEQESRVVSRPPDLRTIDESRLVQVIAALGKT